MSDKAKLIFDGKEHFFDVVKGSESEKALDVSTLRSDLDLITIDPGFKNTGSCKSAITFLDGEKGILRYRGYSIEDLAKNADFLQVAFLLIYGELPTNEEYLKFLNDINENAIVDEDLKKILENFPKSAHPMGILSSLTSALIAFNPEKKMSLKNIEDDREYMYNSIVKLLAKIPILVAWVHRRRKGLPLNYGDYNAGYVENITKMMFQVPNHDMKENISLFVANSFLQILFNKEIVKVQKLQLQLSKDEVVRANELVNNGVIPRGDLFEFEANLVSVEKSLIDAQNSLTLSKLSLAQLLLIEDYENFDIVDQEYELKISNILDKSPKEIFAYAVQNKNEIKIAETNLEIAKKSLELNKSFLQPRLSAFYSFSSRIAYSDRIAPNGEISFVPIGVVENTNQRVLAPIQGTKIVSPPSFSDQFDTNKGQNYGLSLSIPVLNGFSTRSNVNRSKVNVKRSENLLFQRKLDLENTINQAYNDAKGSLKTYEASLKSLESRKLSFEYAQEKFNLGVMNPYEYSQVKQRYESSQSELIRSKFDLIFKLKVLEFYFGVPIEI